MAKRKGPALPTEFGEDFVLAAYGLAGPRPKGGSKKNNPLDPLDVRWLEPQTLSKKAEQQQQAAAARHLGADPNDRKIQDARTQLTGLRNLGATCYMNSLLQSLFMNPAFRQGIYKWKAEAAAATAQSIIGELQLLFSCLQRSHTAYYDTEKLSQALNLDTSVQQDAQEFNKLLLTFLEDQLRDSPELEVAELVQKQFRGKYSYKTECQHCKKESESSKSEYPFYELELNIDEKAKDFTLEKALGDYIKKEQLSDVECSHCKGRHDATRQMALKALPPVLTLQLLRFVYDFQTGSKKKVNAAVKFPAILDLTPFVDGADASPDPDAYRYKLTAVLMHTGGSANSGHYTARILDQTPPPQSVDDERWWNFNDELVKLEEWEAEGKKGGASTVGLLESAGGQRAYSSKTAYMLNYTRVSALRAKKEPPQPPEHVLAQTDRDVQTLEEEVQAFNEAKARQERRLDERRALHEQLAPLLRWGATATPAQLDGGRWVGAEWLQKVMSTSIADLDQPAGPIDCTPFRLDNGKVDPACVGQLKLVSEEAWRVLHERFGGGPELRGADRCQQCCKRMHSDGKKQEDSEEDGLQMAALLKAAPKGEAKWMVAKGLKQHWRKWQKEGRRDASLPLYCQCSRAPPAPTWSPLAAHLKNAKTTPKLAPAAERIEVAEHVMEAVRRVFPETTFFMASEQPCPSCADKRSELRGKRETQRTLLARLHAGTPLEGPLPLTVRLLPEGWREAWVAFVDGGAEPPPPLRAAGLLGEKDGRLQLHPEVATGPWAAHPPNLPLEAPGHAFELRLRERLSAKFDLVLDGEYDAMLEHRVATLEGEPLPRCEVTLGRNGVDWSFTPELDGAAALATHQSVVAELRGFVEELIQVQRVKERDVATSWQKPASGHAAEADAAVEEAEASVAKRPRRACRNASASKAVKASGVSTVNDLKLLCHEAMQTSPSQSFFFFEGKSLSDETALADAGVLPGATVQLFVDETIPADDAAALEKLGVGSKGKQAVEDGFVGCALLGGGLVDAGGSAPSDPMVVDGES